MARSNIRCAAGVGVVAAFLLILGPLSAPAAADKGGSGSHSSDDDRGRWIRGGKGDHLGWPQFGADDRGDREVDRNPQLAESPAVRVGTGRTDQEGLTASENLIAQSSAAEDPGVVTESGTSARSGSGHGRAPTVSVRSPRVVFGNGRSPGLQARGIERPRENPVTPVVAPQVPERVVVDIPPPPRVDRVQPPRLVPKLGAAQSKSSSDPLFGLAGLVLIPAVGAALGYRQARAAHGAARSGRP